MRRNSKSDLIKRIKSLEEIKLINEEIDKRKNRVLSTKNAGIKTVQVNIKALVVGNKQVTISMFKQFPRETIFKNENIDGELKPTIKGEPWGVIIHDYQEWLLWQDGNILKIGDHTDARIIRKLMSKLEKELEQLFIAV